MSKIPTPYRAPSPYETAALQDIRTWRSPSDGFVGRAMKQASDAMESATAVVRKIPGADWTLDTVVGGMLDLVNEIAQDFVWTEGVYRDLQSRGLSVEGPGDAMRLDMEVIDGAVKGLRGKYASLATAEGAATGAAGAAGILPDILGVTAINLRAAGEYATHYGFDIRLPEERLYALNVLGAVAGGDDLNRDMGLKPVKRATAGVAKRQLIESAGQFAFAGTLKKAIEKLGLHLTRAKLLQMMPAIGAVVGGSFNLVYTRQVCTTSYHLYRERFLVAKYGPDVLTLPAPDPPAPPE